MISQSASAILIRLINNLLLGYKVKLAKLSIMFSGTHTKPQRQQLRMVQVCVATRTKDSGDFVSRPPATPRSQFLTRRMRQLMKSIRQAVDGKTRNFPALGAATAPAVGLTNVVVPAASRNLPLLSADLNRTLGSKAQCNSRSRIDLGHSLLVRINAEKRALARSMKMQTSLKTDRFPTRAVRLPLICYTAKMQRTPLGQDDISVSSSKAAIAPRSPFHRGAKALF